MAFTVERIEDEPIVIVRVTNPLGDTVEETRASDKAVADAAADIEGTYYRITDVTELDITFTEIVYWLAEQKHAAPGSINDPRLIPLTIGGKDIDYQAIDWAKQEQYGGREIQLFATLDDALAHARQASPTN